jgi:hypothetical protein
MARNPGGLFFSMFVSLLLIPSLYLLAQPRAARAAAFA